MRNMINLLHFLYYFAFTNLLKTIKIEFRRLKVTPAIKKKLEGRFKNNKNPLYQNELQQCNQCLAAVEISSFYWPGGKTISLDFHRNSLVMLSRTIYGKIDFFR